MRHGQSGANVLGVVVGDPRRGVAGFGLTERGRRQVIASVTAFKEMYTPSVNDTEIIASDFLRTRETAELLGKHLGNAIPVRLSERLRERSFGELEGMEHRNMAVLLEREGLATLIERYGCEPAESVHSRVVNVIRDLEYENPDKTLILVSHADPIQFLMAAFAGLDMSEHERIVPLNCAEVVELEPGMPVPFK
jgi:probable phosphoglycerate mutase